MAKVMISLPDDLLADLDRSAKERGSTRSGLIRELAEDHVRRARGEKTRRIRELLSHAAPHDGKAVEHIRADRSR
jgi:metal-responsive CopG/Arc/MetJ family transcriptional regulator